MMELRQIRYAAAVARHGSFSKAAEALYLTQQALSQQIGKLEREIGFALFERSTRSVVPTEKGAQFLRGAKPVLEAFDAFAGEVAALRDDSAVSLRIGVLPTFSHLNILEAAGEFQTRCPSSAVSLQIQASSRLLELLAAGRLDAVIVSLSGEELTRRSREYAVRVLARDRIRAVLGARHRLAGQKSLSLADLRGETVVLLPEGSSIRSCMDAAFRQAGVVPSATLECPEIHSMIGMLRAELGVGFLSSRIAKEYEQPSIRSVPIEPPPETVTAFLYAGTGGKAEALAAFAGCICQKLN